MKFAIVSLLAIVLVMAAMLEPISAQYGSGGRPFYGQGRVHREHGHGRQSQGRHSSGHLVPSHYQPTGNGGYLIPPVSTHHRVPEHRRRGGYGSGR
ncbi:hypothetical protein HDE_12507 [Halotydeus destructor]|nr:hypothetical protein HDE_12507 [Halotydeus destructor]